MGRTAQRITEKEFMAQVVKLARLYRWLTYHTHDSRRCVAGFPDLVLVRDDALLFAELKVGKGKLTTEQASWIAALEAAGAPVYLWRPIHWTSIEAVLRDGPR